MLILEGIQTSAVIAERAALRQHWGYLDAGLYDWSVGQDIMDQEKQQGWLKEIEDSVTVEPFDGTPQ